MPVNSKLCFLSCSSSIMHEIVQSRRPSNNGITMPVQSQDSDAGSRTAQRQRMIPQQQHPTPPTPPRQHQMQMQAQMQQTPARSNRQRPSRPPPTSSKNIRRSTTERSNSNRRLRTGASQQSSSQSTATMTDFRSKASSTVASYVQGAVSGPLNSDDECSWVSEASSHVTSVAGSYSSANKNKYLRNGKATKKVIDGM
jgi:hypothetical protein